MYVKCIRESLLVMRNVANEFDFVQLPERPAGWDQCIRKFATKTLFHEAAWLDFMAEVVPQQRGVDYFEIRQHGDVAGYYCSLALKKFGFTFYESPWLGTTVYQGPVVDRDIDQSGLMRALMRNSKQNSIASITMENDWMDPTVMRESGFTSVSSMAHVCPLRPDETAVWNAMNGTCRTRIRKSEKLGLTAEETHSKSIADHFYRFFTKVLAQKSRQPAYGIEFPRALLKLLSPAKRLLPICVKYRDKIIGAAFYAYDERAMYYLDGASDPDYLHLSPNELMHWTAMKLAIRRGIPVFNIGGAPAPSRFTRKFGGGPMLIHTYRKNFVPFLDVARRLYAMRHRI